MKANELADELETSVNTGLRFTAATMLRTIPVLEAEIELLKAKLENLENDYCQLLNGEDY